jgi:hypothetical protein
VGSRQTTGGNWRWVSEFWMTHPLRFDFDAVRVIDVPLPAKRLVLLRTIRELFSAYRADCLRMRHDPTITPT